MSSRPNLLFVSPVLLLSFSLLNYILCPAPILQFSSTPFDQRAQERHEYDLHLDLGLTLQSCIDLIVGEGVVKSTIKLMGSNDDAIQIPIDALERHLLSGSPSFSKKEKDEDEEDASMVLYTASFEEMEERFIKYQTAKWVLYSLVLILAWGIGLLMLLYLPVRIYIARKEFRSKKLYLTPDAIIYKVCRPLSIPCFGDLKKEKYIILPSVADVILEQGYIQSCFGLYSIRIEYKGVRRPASDDVNIQGIAIPSDFQKAVLTQLSSIRSEQLGKQASTSLEVPSGDLILQKLDEVEGSLKRVHALIETRAHKSQTLD